jgi:hypothetical protein
LEEILDGITLVSDSNSTSWVGEYIFIVHRDSLAESIP